MKTLEVNQAILRENISQIATEVKRLDTIEASITDIKSSINTIEKILAEERGAKKALAEANQKSFERVKAVAPYVTGGLAVYTLQHLSDVINWIREIF